MELFTQLAQMISDIVGTYIVPTRFLVACLLGTGVFLTLRLGFIQLRRLKHGIEVTSGKYDNPNEPGDVSHFQALSTALSATVGVGNIAGVAIAIHWGGPGALFWMWVTAFLGMAVKYSEVTLSLNFRSVEKNIDKPWLGTVSGGPMYSIERGLGPKWKPLAIFFALGLLSTSFLTGNAIQANTVSDLLHSEFGINVYLTGLVSAILVGGVIFGGIKRIGQVTAVLAPVMAIVYVAGCLLVLGLYAEQVLPAFFSIFREAFNPTSGVAGTGVGAFLVTMEMGVKRGLFSNEAGQGSAPIAHSAAQTEEPVSEGVVALLEPFIDTIIICSLTGLVLLSTGVWNSKRPTELLLNGNSSGFVAMVDGSYASAPALERVEVVDGLPQYQPAGSVFSYRDVPVEKFFLDLELTKPFTGSIDFKSGKATAADGTLHPSLFGESAETGAPLTTWAFSQKLGATGRFIVILSVALFAISTAISWSYYGDRCANYIFGHKAILPYKFVYVIFHFLGAVTSLNVIWGLGDTALSLVTLPNLLSLWLLSGLLVKLTNSYFDRKAWLKNEHVPHKIKH